MVPKVWHGSIKFFNAHVVLLKSLNINLELMIMFCKVVLHIQPVQVILSLLCWFIFCLLNPYRSWNRVVDPSDYLWIVCFPRFQFNFIFSIMFVFWLNKGFHILLFFRKFRNTTHIKMILFIQLDTNRLKRIILIEVICCKIF